MRKERLTRGTEEERPKNAAMKKVNSYNNARMRRRAAA
jgi:hypothetical protein